LASKKVETKPGNRWNPIVRHIANNLQQLNRAIAAFGRDDAEFGHMLRIAFESIARCRTSICRVRCSIRLVCCSCVLIGTNRIDGRVTASQIAAASLAPFLPRLR
jgi:hypothetical protein